MAEEGLKIKIGADVQAAVTSLNTLNASLNKTTQTAANVGTSGMKSLTNETGKANIALVNFGRVVQDAPFGLIGIANNIDPLLTSFQSLKRETGSSQAAFKALAASLTGPAGIAIAISTITSALIAFGPKIADFLNGVSESEKALQEIAGTTAETFRKAQLEFEKLSNVITSGYSTYDQQKKALDDINQSLSAYGLQIKNVSDFQKNASQIGILYTQIKQEEARGLALAAKSAEEYAKQIVNQSLALQASARLAAGQALGPLNGLWVQLSQSVIQYNAQTKVTSAIQNQNIYNNALATSNANLQNLLNQLGKVQGVTTTTSNKQSSANKKANKSVFDLTDALKNYNEELKGINWDEQNRQIDGVKKRLDLAGETLKTLYVAGVKETSAAWIKVKSDFDKFQSAYDKFLRDQRLKEINEGVSELRTNIGSFSEKELAKGQENAIKGLQKVGEQFLANYNLQQKGLADLQKKNEELAGTITNILSPALEGVFESIVKGEDPFEALQNSVKQLVIQLGRAVIQSLILKAVTSAIGAPGVGAVAGQALGLGTVRGDALSFFISRGR